MKNFGWGIGLLLILANLAVADNLALIQDIEALRNSLSANDPSRKTLTLRLADLYFDRAVDLSGRGGDFLTVDKSRKRALSLYKTALSGTKFYSGLSGDLAYKVKFQMARLYQDLHDMQKALPLWKELESQKHLTRLRREAALRLAEYADEKGQFGQAARYYQTALDLCEGGDTCSYIRYRRAWLIRNEGKLEPAIAEMKASLYDSKGRVREESLRDLLVFLAARDTDGQKALVYVEDLSKSLQRPELLGQLTEAFFSAGNRKAGANILAYTNSKKPSLDAQVRLLEEYYGSRNWETFRELLDQMLAAPAPASAEEKDILNREKILRRLTVQLDGERTSKKTHTEDFQNIVALYLNLYPKKDTTYKMMEGWLAVEKDPMVRVQQIESWTGDPKFALSEKQKEKMLTMRKAVLVKKYRDEAQKAQKDKDYEATIAAVEKLFELEDKKTHRELKYIKARAYYGMKNYEAALPLFTQLSTTDSAKPDKWAIQSKHLVLDIYNTQKNYDALITQAATWTANPALTAEAKKNKELKAELAEMEKVRLQALFEQTVAAGETQEALEQFFVFCTSNQFTPKSCENAKVLAVKLGDEPKLIALLEKANAKEELLSEYEAAGFYAKAGKLFEELRLSKNKTHQNYLKAALLYELADQNVDRNRVLNNYFRFLGSKKEMGEAEPLIRKTFMDAGMYVSRASLKLPWSQDNKLELADKLEKQGKGSAQTKKIILSAKSSTGETWAKYVLPKIQELDNRQRRYKFYGRNSQSRFARRLRELKKLTSEADKWLPAADAATRVEILSILANAHADLAQQVLDTPLPKELQGEALTEVQGALVKMSSPFQEKVQSYKEMAREQLAKVDDLSKRAGLQAKWFSDEPVQQIAQSEDTAPEGETPAAESAQSEVKDLPSVSTLEKQEYMARIRKNPRDKEALIGVKQYYDARGDERLAAYYQGRILQLGDAPATNGGEES